eukprot:scaffold5255_cov110-Isochrysis_galbana.AAC.2
MEEEEARELYLVRGTWAVQGGGWTFVGPAAAAAAWRRRTEIHQWCVGPSGYGRGRGHPGLGTGR